MRKPKIQMKVSRSKNYTPKLPKEEPKRSFEKVKINIERKIEKSGKIVKSLLKILDKK